MVRLDSVLSPDCIIEQELEYSFLRGNQRYAAGCAAGPNSRESKKPYSDPCFCLFLESQRENAARRLDSLPEKPAVEVNRFCLQASLRSTWPNSLPNLRRLRRGSRGFDATDSSMPPTTALRSDLDYPR